MVDARTQSLEGSRRTNALIANLVPNRLSGELLMQARSIEMLERLAIPAARRLLLDLGGGGPGALITDEPKRPWSDWTSIEK